MEEIIYVKNSLFGKGIFASRTIKKGEKICIMKGKKISAKQLDKVVKSGRNILVDPLQIADDRFINLTRPYVLINHSCSPNAGIKKENVLFALRDIKKDEEILFDYSSVWLEGFVCKCESKNCRKYIGDFFTLPGSVQKKYMKLGIVPRFIKTKIQSMK